MLLSDFKKLDQTCMDLLVGVLVSGWPTPDWRIAKPAAEVLFDALEEREFKLKRTNDLASWFRFKQSLGIFGHRERYGDPNFIPALRIELFSAAEWTKFQNDQKKKLEEEAERAEYLRLKAKFGDK